MECSVKFLDNLKDYYEPGQKVKAEVVIILSKTEKINKITCSILGYAKCKWNEDNVAGNGGKVVTNIGHEPYIKECFDLLENLSQKPSELNSGLHKFNVSYVLSSNLPTSFKCKFGSIKYKIEVKIDRPWKLKSTFKFPFTIISPQNLNRAGNHLRNPTKDEVSKYFKMDFTTDPLLVSASIPFSGYVPGQTINIEVDVKNQSMTHVKGVKVSLKKIVILNSTKPKRKTKVLILSEAKVLTESIAVQTVKNFKEKLIVPSLPPNISNCDLIKVSYELRVKAKTSGFNRSPKIKLPIVIGTSPLIGLPNSPSCVISLPPSYEESQRDYNESRNSSESSDGDSNFNPRYPVFEFEDVFISPEI